MLYGMICLSRTREITLAFVNTSVQRRFLRRWSALWGLTAKHEKEHTSNAGLIMLSSEESAKDAWSDWLIAPGNEEYTLVEGPKGTLGEGASGVVKKARDKTNGKIVAI